MPEPAVEGLSEREVACLDHLRQAKALGISLAEYCRRGDLNVGEWYRVKQGLAHKGVTARGVVASKKVDQLPATFTPVRIASAAASSVMTACRIKHPSGWVVECAILPQPSWLAALMGAQHP